MTISPLDLAKKHLIEALKIGDKPVEEQERMVENLAGVLSSAVSLAVMEALSEEERQEFVSLLETKTEGELVSWLNEKIDDLDGLIKTQVRSVLQDLSLI